MFGTTPKLAACVAGALCCIALHATPVFAQADAPQSSVEALLSGVETTATSEQWAAVGNDAVPVLVSVLNDEQQSVVRRGRAAIALGNFAVTEGVAALRAVLDTTLTPNHLRRKAIVALARVDGQASIAVLGKQLEHRSKRVRETAIRAVGEVATTTAQELLRARVALEKSSYLQDVLAEELKRPQAVATPTPKEAPQPEAEVSQ